MPCDISRRAFNSSMEGCEMAGAGQSRLCRRWSVTAALVALLLIGVSSCDKEDSIVDVVLPGNSANRSLLLQLVNAVRQQGCNCGGTQMPPVAPLTWSGTLESAAFKHATDMSVNNFFSHTGSDSSTCAERLTREGYRWSTCGENIAWGYATDSAVIGGWLSSPGHCRNIMGASFREMGVGRVGNYWVQDFGTPR
jgi:uncharacterized protein YkwD